MSTDYKAQKESCASRSVDILFLLYFVFAFKMSVAGQVYSFAAFAREICTRLGNCTRICVCACVCVFVRMYVGVAVT